MTLWKRVEILGLFALGFLAVVLGGLFLFRWRYGIDNIYKPTVDFLRSDVSRNSEQNADGWYWLRYRLWVYTPLLVIGAWQYLARADGTSPSTAQNGRSSGFWRLSMPSTSSCSSASIRSRSRSPSIGAMSCRHSCSAAPRSSLRSVESTDGRWILLFTGGLLLVLAVLPSPHPEVFPSWAIAVGAVLVGCVVVARWGPRYTLLLPGLLIGLLMELQAGTPRPESQPLELVYDPAYASALHPDRSQGQDTFRSATWFVDEMDKFGDRVERDMYFWIGEGDAHRLAAMYEAQVSGRWINVGWEENATGRTEIPTATAANFRSGLYPHLAVIGSPDQVDTVANLFRALRPDAITIFDRLAPSHADASGGVGATEPGRLRTAR